MKTNFFHQIQAFNVKGNWTINMLSGEDGKITVSVLLTPSRELKEGGNIQPLLLKGTADELAEGFFGAITQPVAQTTGLFNNAAEYQQSLEKAKEELAKKASASKAKTEIKKEGNKNEAEPTVSKEEKKKAYDAVMKRVTELNDACKYEEALALLPKVEDYPEKETELQKKTEDLTRKRDQKAQALQLFNA